MSKKILIIGNGAKEYALAKKLSGRHEVFVTPASDTLKEFATCLDLRADSVSEIMEYVMENGIDLTIPVSQDALKSDITARFEENNLAIFAPSNKASRLIYDKAYAKKVLYKLRIPTPKFGIFEKENLVLDYIKNLKTPFVLKNDDPNSAAVFTSYQVAKNIVSSSFVEKNKRIIIEDYVYGTPFSFYTITDGYKALPIGSSITYKHSLEGNGGQLTEGMGACVPNYKLSIESEYFLMDNVIYPTLDYLQIEGNTYSGILGVNGVLSEDGRISVLGWQSFMQDCDATAVLDQIDEDLYSLMQACSIGSFSDEFEMINIKDMQSASVVLNCKNTENTENIINGLEILDDDTIITYYPQVKKNKYLEFEIDSKGAVMSLTSSAATLSRAIENVYNDIEEISFYGKFFRKDIGG